MQVHEDNATVHAGRTVAKNLLQKITFRERKRLQFLQIISVQ